MVVLALLAVLAELFVQARYYAWLSGYFNDPGDTRMRLLTDPPVGVDTIRLIWVGAVGLLLVALVLQSGRRWFVAVALVACAGSLWLTPSRMALPGSDPNAPVDIGQADSSYQAGLALLALAAVAVAALLLMPRKSA